MGRIENTKKANWNSTGMNKYYVHATQCLLDTKWPSLPNIFGKQIFIAVNFTHITEGLPMINEQKFIQTHLN